METIGLFMMYAFAAYDDIREKKIRIFEIAVFAILGLIINIMYHPYSLISVAGGVSIGICMLLFSIFTKEKIGMGDAYLIMVTGLYMGFMNTAIILWISSVFAVIVGLFIAGRNNNYKTLELPFVPFLLLGYIVLFIIKCQGGIIG